MDIERIILIGGILVQSVVYRFNKLVSAILGFAITTFVLIWGISAYRDYGAMAFFGIELPEVVFYIACGVWYVVDIYTLFKAIKAGKAVAPAEAPPAPPADSAQ